MYLELGERLGEIFYANKWGKIYQDGCTPPLLALKKQKSFYKSTGLIGNGIVPNLFWRFH